MGKVFSTVAHYCPDSVAMTIHDVYNRRREKRKRESESNEEAELLESLHSPKRMKLQCTAQYIYQTLFISGKDSDITVNILNKDWKLHKVYLGQSQYFNSMFSGSWNESNKTYISIEVEDPNITEDALLIVFGSFYLDEVKMEPCSVVGVLAAASMFQMDGLLEQCYDIMIDSVCPLTAVQYYQAACNYGLKSIKEKILNWFSINLTDYYLKNVRRLKEIDVELMQAIVSHPNLNVIQTEMALYYVLRKWLYLQLTPQEEVSDDPSKNIFEKYFRGMKGDIPFLLTEKGMDYLNIFRAIRLENLVLNLCDIPAVVTDGIIPERWLLEAYRKQWLTMLEIFNGNKGVNSIDENFFIKNCYRCGRTINAEDTLSWRWSGYSFGIDLIWTLVDNTVQIKRQRSQIEYNNVATPHNLLLRVEILNLDERRQVKKHADSGIMKLSLVRNQDFKVMTIDKDFEYPIHFLVRMLVSDRERREKGD